jgi:hypothetical protein
MLAASATPRPASATSAPRSRNPAVSRKRTIGAGSRFPAHGWDAFLPSNYGRVWSAGP